MEESKNIVGSSDSEMSGDCCSETPVTSVEECPITKLGMPVNIDPLGNEITVEGINDSVKNMIRHVKDKSRSSETASNNKANLNQEEDTMDLITDTNDVQERFLSSPSTSAGILSEKIEEELPLLNEVEVEPEGNLADKNEFTGENYFGEEDFPIGQLVEEDSISRLTDDSGLDCLSQVQVEAEMHDFMQDRDVSVSSAEEDEVSYQNLNENRNKNNDDINYNVENENVGSNDIVDNYCSENSSVRDESDIETDCEEQNDCNAGRIAEEMISDVVTTDDETLHEEINLGDSIAGEIFAAERTEYNDTENNSVSNLLMLNDNVQVTNNIKSVRDDRASVDMDLTEDTVSKTSYTTSESDSENSESGESWVIYSDGDDLNASTQKLFDKESSYTELEGIPARGRLRDMTDGTVSEANLDLYYLEEPTQMVNNSEFEKDVVQATGPPVDAPSSDAAGNGAKQSTMRPATLRTTSRGGRPDFSRLEMEERTAGTSASSKDKKYVLYTVVGDDRHRTTPSTWMLRILLGSLMVVALAVVPYVSLRIAQANSRTLVVFQPVPVHNRTNNHRSIHKHDTSSIRSKTVKLMEVADLTLENYTSAGKLNETNKQNSTLLLQHSGNGTGYITDAPLSSLEVTSNNNSITVTLQESDVAIALLDDKNSTTLNGSKIRTSSKTNKLDNEEGSTDDTLLSKNETETTTIDAKNTLKVNPKLLSTSSVSSSQVAVDDSVASTKSTSSMNPTTEKPKTSSTKIQTTPNNKGTVIAEEINKSTTTLPLQKALSHKLVYVATSASGNHVGGICIWKVDKNVTNWSYFYDNIPIEFQSGHDAGDHELRASLAAVRTWSSLWQDAHVTLRSQHNAIEHSNLAIRKDLVKELEKLSEGHFTYELEWRLPEADTLVKIASSLSRLHQDYKFWFEDFKSHVSELLGSKSWDDASKEKHIKISENAFFTDETATTVSTVVDNNAGNKSVLLSVLSSTANPVTPTSRPLSHKLVYVATSASGNHVGGFCLWKLDKNVTDWSYFYDNIPVEYQSNHDSADHEQRATLAAVRVWAKRWEDAHVTLRSQHAAIERSDGVLRRILVDNLDRLSEGHFTYDLEWRLRKSDDLVKISFSLSRLNRNFGHWFAVFKASVDDILGAQNWNDATKSKRVLLNDEHFYTEETRPEINQASLQSTLAELEN